MLSGILFRSRGEKLQVKACRCVTGGYVEEDDETSEEEMHHHVHSVPFQRTHISNSNIQLKSANKEGNVRKGERRSWKMSKKASNFSGLIQRVTGSCLLHPLAGVSQPGEISEFGDGDMHIDLDEEDGDFSLSTKVGEVPSRPMELQLIVAQVFDAVSALKRAYIGLQEAHCPWDAEKMRVADVAIVAELRRLNLLRERFKRGGGKGGRWGLSAASLREVVAPYEGAIEDLKKEVKAKHLEVEGLRDKLKTATSLERSNSKLRGRSRRRVSCSTQAPVAPMVELFEETMSLVKEASKAFTSLLLSLMRSANWDIAAAVRSIEAASSAMNFNPCSANLTLGANHARYALESYVNRKIFLGFDHETFYMDGSLSSILHPDQHRRDCFAQYHDMKAMDPVELLGLLPTCSFGNFCSKKYLSIVHLKMEESLFGDLEQRQQLLDGHHPRSQFYGEFLGLAKAVWLLHLLAFSLDPPPGHFEASKGVEFHPQYMESVVKTAGIDMGGSKIGVSMIVGISVSPGFKLGDGSIIKARVYLVPKN